MQLPQSPKTLTPEEVEALNARLSRMRHNINNSLSLILAGVELIQFKPDARDRLLKQIGDQPDRIMAEIKRFTEEFEQLVGITRDPEGPESE